jgi:hypothetical protein
MRAIWVFMLALCWALPVMAADGTETILLLRHGEKPAAGLGQLDCQGLNRAMALPTVIRRDYGTPTAIFAPNPGVTKPDGGVAYNYIRPLATIEPVAVALGMPVNTSLGLDEIGKLQGLLEAPALHNGVVLVGWEHSQIVLLARAIMASHGGDPQTVPNWRGSDFDGVYVLRIIWSGAASSITFERRVEGLNGQSTACP